MTRLVFLFYGLFYIVSVNVLAADEKKSSIDISDIENQERQQIIKELSWRLNTKKVCGLTLTWDDSGSGADKDGYFFIPPAKDGQYMIGGYGAGKRVSDYHCVFMVNQPADNPKGTPPLLVAPVDWKMIWKDSGSGAHKDGSIWQAVPPDKNYRCLGSVSVVGYNKPNLPNYRCVHASVTEKIVANSLLWSDSGSGAEQQVSIFRLPQTISMIAVSGRVKQVEAYDLTKNASSTPDPKRVEAILQERLALLKAEIEAQAQALLAKREQEQKALAEAAEKKRLAEVAKKKAEAETAQAAAEKLRLAEAERKEKEAAAAKAMADATAEAKQKLAEAEEKQQQMASQMKTAKAVSKEAAAEEQRKKQTGIEVKQQAAEVTRDVTEETKAVVEEPVASVESEAKVSKGINDLILYFAKYIAILFGGIILLVIIFKLLFGSKKSANKE